MKTDHRESREPFEVGEKTKVVMSIKTIGAMIGGVAVAVTWGVHMTMASVDMSKRLDSVQADLHAIVADAKVEHEERLKQRDVLNELSIKMSYLVPTPHKGSATVGALQQRDP